MGCWLDKIQTDLLGWTDKDDPNDVIVVDDQGKIIKRRPMSMLVAGEGYSRSEHFHYELDDKGKWIGVTVKEDQ